MKLYLKRGDKVRVLSGSSKGKEGSVLAVNAKTYRAVVEGVNFVKKHVKPTNDNPGGIVEQEAPVHISNLMLVDPKSGEATRIRRDKVDGKSVRVSVKSGEIIK